MIQKGFVPIILLMVLAAVVLAGGGVYLYNTQQSSPPAQITPQSPSPQNTTRAISPSPKATAKSKGIPIQVTTTISTAKPSSTPNSQGLTPPVAAEIIINASGNFTYSSQEIKYAISFPKNGGNVAGTISGVCNGPIVGNFSGGDGGLLKSSVDAKCKIGILEQDLKADFEGKVYFSQGRADLEWQGEIPFYSGSKQFSLSFTPL